MDQSRLTAAAGCAIVLAAGAAAEIAWPRPTVLLAVADYGAGFAFAVCGAWLVATWHRWGWISMATAAAWFAGTAAAAAPWLPDYLSDVTALGYRAFVLLLLGRMVSQRRLVTLAGFAAVLLPVPADGVATIAVIAALGLVAARAAPRSPSDLRRALTACALWAAALGIVWWLSAAGVTGGALAYFANDLAMIVTALALTVGWAREDWVHAAISSLVIELGPSGSPAAPVSALLARALADPDLDVRYTADGVGWFDEHGVRVAAPPVHGPDAEAVTRVAAPNGGEVALIPGPSATAGQALSMAAAAAAALALESARIDAEVRRQATAVRESRRRLLSVADAERQALEARLQAGPVGRLIRVDGSLALLDDQAARDIRAQLGTALEDLARLGRGLYPGQLGARPLDAVLQDLAAGMPMPVQLIAEGSLEQLPAPLQALAYFFCSECLTNVARHAQAISATVTVVLTRDRLRLSVHDDGKGGAGLSGSRGLRGLADRIGVAGGVLTADSPQGGPTCIRADVPVPVTAEPASGSG